MASSKNKGVRQIKYARKTTDTVTRKTTETDIQNKIRIALSKYGIVFRMNVGLFFTADGRPIQSGLPPGTSDLLFIGHGKIAFIEVKTPKGRPTQQQLNFIQAMKNLGHIAGIARSVEDALRLISPTDVLIRPINKGE